MAGYCSRQLSGAPDTSSLAPKGDRICGARNVRPNRTLLPQAAIERELLDLLQQEVLTPATLDRLLTAVNAKLRAQAVAARPRVRELRRALTQVNREIENYGRAVARGDFTSLERALAAAEQRRATLQNRAGPTGREPLARGGAAYPGHARTVPPWDDRGAPERVERQSSGGDPAVGGQDPGGRRWEPGDLGEAGWTPGGGNKHGSIGEWSGSVSR
jgi:hypothetical protein